MARRRQKRNSRGDRYGGLGRERYLQLTLGPTAGRVKARSSPAAWRRIKRAAHSRGMTVEGFLSDVPNPLKERSPQGLREEARRLVETSYKPAEKELSQQEARIKAIDEKRARDNQFYLQWLSAQSAKMRSEAAAADQLIADRSRAVQDELRKNMSQLQNDIVAAANSRVGNVSKATANTPALDLSANMAANNAEIANARQGQNLEAGISQQSQQLGAAANFAFMAAQEARRQADTWNALKDVADKRDKLTLQKAADIAKEVARLLDREIDKANANREFGAVQARLGLDAAKLEETRRSNRAKERIARGRLREQQRHNRATERQDRAKLRETIRNNRRKDKGDGKGGGKGGDRSKDIRNARKLYQRARSLARQVRRELGGRPTAASVLDVMLNDYKFEDPALAAAAAMEVVYGGVDQRTRSEIHRSYGIYLRPSRRR